MWWAPQELTWRKVNDVSLDLCWPLQGPLTASNNGACPSGVRKQRTSDSDEEWNRPFFLHWVHSFSTVEVSWMRQNGQITQRVSKPHYSAVNWDIGGDTEACREERNVTCIKEVLFSMWSHCTSPCDEYLIRSILIYILKSNYTKTEHYSPKVTID